MSQKKSICHYDVCTFIFLLYNQSMPHHIASVGRQHSYERISAKSIMDISLKFIKGESCTTFEQQSILREIDQKNIEVNLCHFSGR